MACVCTKRRTVASSPAVKVYHDAKIEAVRPISPDIVDICREKDLDEVLQTTTVFTNVSKAAVAKHEDLMDVFGIDDEEKVCLRILAEGDLQASFQTASQLKGLMASVTAAPMMSASNDHIRPVTMVCLILSCLQMSGKERIVELSIVFKDGAHIRAEKCINPKTQPTRPFPLSS